MDNQIKTSFIPRKSLAPSATIPNANLNPQNKTTASSFFSFIATIIFLVICVGYGALFLWEYQLKNKIVSQEKQMQESIKVLDESFIQSATRLDTRIKEANKIIRNHVSPSTLYAFLSEYTLASLSFSKFTFADNRDGTIKLKGEGEAFRYESIVLQSDEFAKSKYLRNILFSDLSRENNIAKFSFEAQLDPNLILYRERKDIINSPTQ
jgi:hypothetical protein